MINNAVRCALGLILASQSAWADSNSPTYKKAKEAYVAGNCNVAVALLEKYQSEDVAFLIAHKEKNEAIDKAISYCKNRMSWHFVGGAHGVDPNSDKPATSIKNKDLPSKPELP